jgi:hypothetical protein
MIVSNATPLIAFARIGELTLLERLVRHVTLPEIVWSEVTAVTTHPGAEAIGQATWIAVHKRHGVHPSGLRSNSTKTLECIVARTIPSGAERIQVGIIRMTPWNGCRPTAERQARG